MFRFRLFLLSLWVVWVSVLSDVSAYNISDWDIPYDENTATTVQIYNHYLLPVDTVAVLDIVGIRRLTAEDRFLHQLIVAVDKVGLPGKPFRFALSWTESTICTPLHPHLFSNSWNDTDIFFIPKIALRFTLDHDGCNTGDIYGSFGFGADSPIWKYFPVATLNIYPLGKSKKGEITLGTWNRHAFKSSDTQFITVKCQVFPSVCTTHGTVFRNMSVVVSFSLGGHSILLGSAVHRIFELFHEHMPLFSVDINGIVLEFDDLVEVDTNFADNSPDMKSPYVLVAPSWFQLHKPKVHLCPDDLCPNGNELIIGTLVADLSVVLNHNDSTITIGARSHPDQSESDAIEALLFFILFFIGHIYLNPQSRFPPFLNHEAMDIVDSTASKVMFSSGSSSSESTPPQVYPPAPRPLVATTVTNSPLDLVTASHATVHSASPALPSSQVDLLSIRQRRGVQKTDGRPIYPGSDNYVVNRVYSADTDSVFRPEFWVFEFLGWAFCLVIFESMWFAFDITRRIQLFAPFRIATTTIYSQLGIEIYLGIVFNATLFIHLVLIVVSAPIAPSLASLSPVFQSFVMPLLDRYPHLCLLLRLYVYEAELGLALWVCFLAGPVVGAFGLFIVIIGMYFSLTCSIYMLRYFFHFQVRRHVALSVFVVLFYASHLSVLFVYILYPTAVTLWNEDDSTTILVLMTMVLWIAISVIAAIYVWKVFVNDIAQLQSLEPGYYLKFDPETSTYHWNRRVDPTTDVQVTAPPEETSGSIYS